MKIKMKIVCLISCLLLVGEVSATKYTTCDSPEGEITYLTVLGCQSDDTCQVKPGENATITIDFKSKTNSDKVNIKLYGIIDGKITPFPVDKPDACDNTGIDCPIEDGKSYQHVNTVPVESTSPKMNLTVRYVLENGNDSVYITCADIPVEIV